MRQYSSGLIMTTNHLHPDCDASFATGSIKRPRLTEEREKHSVKESMATTNGLPQVNPGLVSLEKDFLYHLGYDNHQCKELFKDVKVSLKQRRSFGFLKAHFFVQIIFEGQGSRCNFNTSDAFITLAYFDNLLINFVGCSDKAVVRRGTKPQLLSITCCIEFYFGCSFGG